MFEKEYLKKMFNDLKDQNFKISLFIIENILEGNIIPGETCLGDILSNLDREYLEYIILSYQEFDKNSVSMEDILLTSILIKCVEENLLKIEIKDTLARVLMKTLYVDAILELLTRNGFVKSNEEKIFILDDKKSNKQFKNIKKGTVLASKMKKMEKSPHGRSKVKSYCCNRFKWYNI